jgi:hypothetical protein
MASPTSMRYSEDAVRNLDSVGQKWGPVFQGKGGVLWR